MRHPFTDYIIGRQTHTLEQIKAIGLPSSYAQFFTEMSARWDKDRAEKCLREALRVEGYPGVIRLALDGLASSFTNRVGNTKAVCVWLRFIADHVELEPGVKGLMVHRALANGSVVALQSLRIQDRSLAPTAQYLSAVVMSRSPDLLAFFPDSGQWSQEVRSFMAEFALYEVMSNTQLKHSEQVLKAFIYPGMDVSCITTDMLNRRPILNALIAHRIKPSPDVMEGVFAHHRTALYKCGILTAEEGRVTAKMKRTALNSDLQL